MRGTERTEPSPRRRRTAGSILLADAVVVLLGTFFVWIILGLAEFDADVADWVTPAAVGLGLLTATVTGALAVTVLRRRERPSLRALAVTLHVGLAAGAAVALGSVLGTVVLIAGAAAAWTAPPNSAA
ncbi:MAG: hypothetical protein PGN13_02500 [Patulibacter minatonensis]